MCKVSNPHSHFFAATLLLKLPHHNQVLHRKNQNDCQRDKLGNGVGNGGGWGKEEKKGGGELGTMVVESVHWWSDGCCNTVLTRPHHEQLCNYLIVNQ